MKTIKLLGEKVRTNLHNLEFDNGFLKMTPKHKQQKTKINCNSSNLETFVHQRTLQESGKKKNPTGWEKIFANHMSDRIQKI